MRGLDRFVPPLVVDVQVEAHLVHDAHGNLLGLDGVEMVASPFVGQKTERERDRGEGEGEGEEEGREREQI